MTKAERKKHRREVLLAAATLLLAEVDNGSGWIFDGVEEDGDAAEYRVSIVQKLAESIERKVRPE